MALYLIRKLELFTKLSAFDKEALYALSKSSRDIDQRQDIIQESETPRHVNLILKGWACRYKYLEDGRRQIISFLLPGDLCDPHVFVLRQMDHSISTLTPVTIAEITREALSDITERHARITQALWWETLVASSVQREWTVNLGQRGAIERLGHLFCEVFLRLRSIGLTEGNTCELPLRQDELADTIGVTPVHINRTMRELRSSGLVELRGRRLTIPNLSALKAASLFNPNYLHLEHEGHHLDANDDDANEPVSS